MLADNALWLYFRILVGSVLLALFVYLIVTGSFDTELITRLLMLLVGILTAGDGVVAYRQRAVKKK